MPLHCAAAGPQADAGEVTRLLSADPSAAARQDGLGMTPLAWACAKGAPADVVRALLSAHPGAAHERSSGGLLPLHWAAQSRACLEVVAQLLSLRAAHATARDALGRLPLHAAAWGGASVAVLDALLEAHPTGGGEEDALGRRPLHHAAGSGGRVEGVAYLLRAVPGAATAHDRRGRTPLHTAAAKAAAAPLLRALLEAYPEAAAARDGESRLPLHYAVQRGASARAVLLLLEAHPAGVGERTRGNLLALHLAAAAGAGADVLALLIAARPEALRERAGGQGRTPLHMAAAGGAPLVSLCELLACWPEGAAARDEEGRLPLHCAAELPASADVILQLLSAHPPALCVPVAGARPLTRWLARAGPGAAALLQGAGGIRPGPLLRAAMHDLVRFPQLTELVRLAMLEEPELAYSTEEGLPAVEEGGGGSVGEMVRAASGGTAGMVAAARPRAMARGGGGSARLMRTPSQASVRRSASSLSLAGGGGGGAPAAAQQPLEAIDVACPACRRVMLATGYFLRRYELLTGPPPPGGDATPGYLPEPLLAYSGRASGTRVLLAIDTWADESSDERFVVLKCVRRPDKLRRELGRRKGLSAQHVVPLLRLHGLDCSPAAAAAVAAAVAAQAAAAGGGGEARSNAGGAPRGRPTPAEEAAVRSVPPYIAVLPRCDGTLDAALSARARPAGPSAPGPSASLARRDWAAMRALARDLAAALAHLHAAGLTHTDLRPSNVAYSARGWRLLDLDGAACHAQAEYVPDRCCAAFAPPEAVYLPEASPGGAAEPAGLRTVAERGVADAWEPASLRAQPSFDAWSLGALLFAAIGDAPLWPDAADGGLSQAQLRALARWDERALAAALAPLAAAPLAGAGPGAEASRAAALDLLRWLLQPRAADRPAMADVLRHVFLDPGGGLDAQALRREAAAGRSLALPAGLGGAVAGAALQPGGLGAQLWRGLSVALSYAAASGAGGRAAAAAGAEAAAAEERWEEPPPSPGRGGAPRRHLSRGFVPGSAEALYGDGRGLL